jgi:hypothetical protein
MTTISSILKKQIAFVLFTIFVLAGVYAFYRSHGNELSLDIVPTPRQPQGDSPILFEGDDFYVVLTNISTKAIPIYEDWSSWGSDSLTLEGVGIDGKVYVLKKLVRFFTRNFPATFIIPPGGHYVFTVHFDKEHWSGLEQFNQNHLWMKAIFSERHSPGRDQVWQGRVESKPRLFGIFH